MKRLIPALVLLIAGTLVAWYGGWLSLGYHALVVHFANLDGKQVALDLTRYRVAIDARPLAGIDDDASGLTYHPGRNTLFTVINKPPQVAELTTTGTLLRVIPLRGATDVEGISHQDGNFFIITDEGTHQMVRIEIDDATREIDTTRLPSFGLTIDARRNVGYEGVSWDGRNHRLFIVKEKNPLRIFQISGLWQLFANEGVNLEISEWLPTNPSRLLLNDLSSITYHEETGHLFVLSDESRLLLEFDADGHAVDMLVLRTGWHGLQKTVPQAEGVAIGPDGDVYILSEPNLFYRFSRAQPK